LSQVIATHGTLLLGILCCVKIQVHGQLTHMPSFSSQVLAGLVLRTEEFANAFVKVYFNLFVQFFTFGVVSSMLFGFSRLMIEIGAISKALGDGMAICGCLSTTINMSVVMTIGADGGENSMSHFFRTFHLFRPSSDDCLSLLRWISQ